MPRINKADWPSMLAIVLIIVLFAGLIPNIFVHTQGTEIETSTIDEGDSIVLKAPLEATLVSVNQGQINVTLVDVKTGDSASTNLLNETETASLSIRGNNVDVTYTEDIGNNAAIVSFEYPVAYEWDTATRTFVGAIALFLLILFLYMMYVLLWEQENGGES